MLNLGCPRSRNLYGSILSPTISTSPVGRGKVRTNSAEDVHLRMIFLYILLGLITKNGHNARFLLLIQSYQLCVYDGFRQILFVTKHQQYLGLSVRL